MSDGTTSDDKRGAEDHQGTEESRDSAQGSEEMQELEENRAAEDETISDSETCPECGAPIENLRATCPKCGYEYADDDYDQPDAGKEFQAGTEVDESGDEVVDDPSEAASREDDES